MFYQLPRLPVDSHAAQSFSDRSSSCGQMISRILALTSYIQKSRETFSGGMALEYKDRNPLTHTTSRGHSLPRWFRCGWDVYGYTVHAAIQRVPHKPSKASYSTYSLVRKPLVLMSQSRQSNAYSCLEYFHEESRRDETDEPV